MVKKKRDTSKKRSAILCAAVGAFKDLGYDRASMDYISEIASVSKRTVYNHFPSKEILFEAVIEGFLDKIYKLKEIPYNKEHSLEKQLGTFADLKIALAQDKDQLALMRVIFAVLITHPELATKTYLNAQAKVDPLEKWIKDAVKDGRLKIKDCKVATELFWSMFAGTFFWPPIIHGPIKGPMAKRMKKEFIDTFLARYQQPSFPNDRSRRYQ